MGFYGKKLIRRLQNEYGIGFPDDIEIRRCNPGWSTLSAGGFKWTFQSTENVGFNSFGSQHTIRECAMAETITISAQRWGDVFIDIPITTNKKS